MIRAAASSSTAASAALFRRPLRAVLRSAATAPLLPIFRRDEDGDGDGGDVTRRPSHRIDGRRHYRTRQAPSSSSSYSSSPSFPFSSSSSVRPVDRIRSVGQPASSLAAAGGRTPSLLSSSFSLDSPALSSSSSTSAVVRRSYHATPQNEILPLVALAVVGFTARYSYKALQRMDTEWEEYEEAVREYKANGGAMDVDFNLGDGDAQAETPAASAPSAAGAFRGGVMGIDLGTVNLRLSHSKGVSAGGGGSSPSKPGVVVDREGGRSTPAAVYFDDDSASAGEVGAVWGRLAAAKMHERSDVLNPGRLLLLDDGRTNDAVREVLRPACRNALDQVLGSSSSSAASSSTSGPLFSVDPPSTGGGYNVRPSFAYPPVEDGNTGEWDAGYVSRYASAVADLSSPSSAAMFVPEPVAAVAGAREWGVLLPQSGGAARGTVLVLDVGGTVTSASLVAPSSSENAKHEGDMDVVECLRLPSLGGEALVEALANHVARDFFGVGREKGASEVKDGMALQRLYDAARMAVMEVSGGKNRVQVNVPYLTVDERMRPRHLDMGVGADVLEAEMNDLVSSRADEYDAAGVLSKNMPPAKDLTTAFSSLIMRVLEEGGTNPFELEAVLIVGGGARSPIVQRALRRGLASIAGEQFVDDKMVVPKGELIEELVVLGAAVVGGKS